MMIRMNCYRAIGRCGGNSPMLTKCNSLAGCRVQSASTRCRSGLGLHGLRQQPAPTRPGARRNRYVVSNLYYYYYSSSQLINPLYTLTLGYFLLLDKSNILVFNNYIYKSSPRLYFTLL